MFALQFYYKSFLQVVTSNRSMYHTKEGWVCGCHSNVRQHYVHYVHRCVRKRCVCVCLCVPQMSQNICFTSYLLGTSRIYFSGIDLLTVCILFAQIEWKSIRGFLHTEE